MEKYLEQILEILDRAAGDKTLSTEDYIELCASVEDEANGKRYASEADLRRKQKEK